MRKTFLAIAIIVMALTSLAAQSVKVDSPNGGEQWALNATQNITWTSTNAGSLRVNIVLRNSGGLVGVIKSQVLLSAGSWTWTVGKLENGTTVPAGSNYIVRIRDAANGYSDDSNNPFSIITAAPPPPPPPGGPASITVASPNGGESWPSGSTKNILWTAANWSGTVQLNLWQNGAFKGTIATGVPSSPGSYPWPVGKFMNGSSAGIGTDFKVRVIKEYKGGPKTPVPVTPLMDESDGDFSIGVKKIGGPVPVETVKLPKTVSLKPSLSNKWHRKHEYVNALGCPLTSWGLSPTPDPKPLMRTGYSNKYEGGLCWEYLGLIYRGVMRFDFSQIKGQIKEAHVNMICTGTDSNDGTPYCDGSVFVLDGGGSGFDNPCHHYVDLPAGGGPVANNIIKVSGPNIQIVVTDLVKAWIGGQQPNHGLLFLGNNETQSENNDRCISHFQVSLSVTYIPSDTWDPY